MKSYIRPDDCPFPKEKVIELNEDRFWEASELIHCCPKWSIVCFDCQAGRDLLEIRLEETCKILEES